MNIENNIAEIDKDLPDSKMEEPEEPINEIKEVEDDQSKVPKCKNNFKILVKRHPFEKILDDSLRICEDSMSKVDIFIFYFQTDSEVNLEKLLKIFEKEVMKKQEYFLLFQLFEKTKKVFFNFHFF